MPTRLILFEVLPIFGSIINEKDELMKEAVSNDLVGWMNAELNKDGKKFTASMAALKRFRDLDAAEDIQGAALTELFEDFDRLIPLPNSERLWNLSLILDRYNKTRWI